MESNLKQEAERLAEERGYSNPRFSLGYLFVSTETEITVDYCQAILQPRGLVQPGHRCETWKEAVRLLGMLPPARGLKNTGTQSHPYVEHPKIGPLRWSSANPPQQNIPKSNDVLRKDECRDAEVGRFIRYSDL